MCIVRYDNTSKEFFATITACLEYNSLPELRTWKKILRHNVSDEEKWKIACTASGMTNANIVIGRLKAEGIPARLKYEAVGAIYGITIDGLGKVDILVHADDFGRARDILAQTYEESDIDWE